MVRINYCPSCGNELSRGSFICPSCSLDIEELFANGCLLESKDNDNSIELFGGDIDNFDFSDMNMENLILDNPNVNIKSGDEIVIIVPENVSEDELVIDLDELGVDVENLDGDVNIIIQVEEIEGCDDFIAEDDFLDEANEWYFNDDPYGIVYYEFPYMSR